jgi:FMN hydrolase / 5-amino-6-(5-phospho-D-ribitylamino)uracil phosphatase
VTPVRLVTFDGDDTLWALAPVIEAALAESCQAFAAAFPETPVTPDDLTADRLAVQRELPAGTSMRTYRRAAFRRRVDLLGGGSEALVDELCDRFQTLRSSLIEPYPDALGALDRLRPHALLGLISNGNADLELTPFRGRFAFRLHAFVHGPEKPEVEMFVDALAHSGLPADAAVHVGDSLVHDVAGARAAGWRSVWLNRDGVPNASGIEPDAEIASLDELDAALDALVPLAT